MQRRERSPQHWDGNGGVRSLARGAARGGGVEEALAAGRGSGHVQSHAPTCRAVCWPHHHRPSVGHRSAVYGMVYLMKSCHVS